MKIIEAQSIIHLYLLYNEDKIMYLKELKELREIIERKVKKVKGESIFIDICKDELISAEVDYPKTIKHEFHPDISYSFQRAHSSEWDHLDRCKNNYGNLKYLFGLRLTDEKTIFKIIDIVRNYKNETN